MTHAMKTPGVILTDALAPVMTLYSGQAMTLQYYIDIHAQAYSYHYRSVEREERRFILYNTIALNNDSNKTQGGLPERHKAQLS